MAAEGPVSAEPGGPACDVGDRADMPRLNDTEYQSRRAALRRDWNTVGTLLRRLTPDQQWGPARLYLFTRSLDHDELAAARTACAAWLRCAP